MKSMIFTTVYVSVIIIFRSEMYRELQFTCFSFVIWYCCYAQLLPQDTQFYEYGKLGISYICLRTLALSVESIVLCTLAGDKEMLLAVMAHPGGGDKVGISGLPSLTVKYFWHFQVNTLKVNKYLIYTMESYQDSTQFIP